MTTPWPRALILSLSKGFSTLECELLSRRSFSSQAEARMACFTYIEGFYNPLRLHSGLGYRSPIDYERSFHHDQASPMTSLPEQVH
jgi:transposase InsO family protein